MDFSKLYHFPDSATIGNNSAGGSKGPARPLGGVRGVPALLPHPAAGGSARERRPEELLQLYRIATYLFANYDTIGYSILWGIPAALSFRKWHSTIILIWQKDEFVITSNNIEMASINHPLRVMIVDDHELFRHGLRDLLNRIER